MSTMEITTNHHWRDFKYGYEVPDSVLEDQFDWMDEDDRYDGFICYRGVWYNLSDFMGMPPGHPFSDGWHGYNADSFFSGVLIRLSDDGEQYQIATAIQKG